MTVDLSPEIIRLLLVLATTIAAHFAARMFIRRIEKATALTSNIWDDALIEAARRPLPFFIWLTGTFFVLRLIHMQTGERLLEYVAEAQMVSVVACIAWFLIRLTHSVADSVAKAQSINGVEVDRTTIDGLSKLIRVTILLISALVILQSLGFSVSGVLAFGGVGGIAIGFAARDMLANFFGGLMIHLDRPFNVGEKIRSPEKQIEGTVEYIGWRHTRLRADNTNVIYVPNSVFTSIVVENITRMSNRRIQETIGLRYEDIGKADVIAAEIKSMLASHPSIDASRDIIVAFDRFADSALNLTLITFTNKILATEFHATKHDILLKIAAIIARHGADFAYPTQTVHIAKEVL
ncbi:MAG: mechanosensitive ion channel family protein [Gallionella sp.]|nr:mechanosensitive ion channel family protein [Gallionella sp.]